VDLETLEIDLKPTQ